MDFGALAPEINSARIYFGPGSGPMMAAAAAWDGLAIELSSAATDYGSVNSRLTAGPWRGRASASMAAAAAPYLAWLSTTAAQAEQVANQARAAAAAYETAFAAMVPPPVIAANRALLMSLIATNILGQNTPAITATEAHYGEMWAQDAAAMYSYAGSSAAAATLTPFTPPPPDGQSNGAGGAGNCGRASHRHLRCNEHPGGTVAGNFDGAHGAAGACLAPIVRNGNVVHVVPELSQYRFIDDQFSGIYLGWTPIEPEPNEVTGARPWCRQQCSFGIGSGGGVWRRASPQGWVQVRWGRRG